MDIKAQMIQQIAELQQKVPFDFIEAGRALTKIKHEFGVAEMFNVAESTGIRSRTASYFSDLAERFYKEGDRKRLLKIGWTKLKTIIPHLKDNDLSYLLECAEEKSVQNLKAGLESKPNIEHVWNLNFSMKHMGVVNQTVLKLGGKNKAGEWVKSKEEIIVEICRLALKAIEAGLD